jgi:predicted nucleic acid-binding protein
MPIAAVVADANVLLSAAIGKAALRVFTEHVVKVHTTEFKVAEVEEYLPRLTSKYGLPQPAVLLQWSVLPKVVHAVGVYNAQLAAARRALADRDPDDVHPLALAMTLHLPIWSNDRDLQGTGVPCYSTAQLLNLLEATSTE